MTAGLVVELIRDLPVHQVIEDDPRVFCTILRMPQTHGSETIDGVGRSVGPGRNGGRGVDSSR